MRRSLGDIQSMSAAIGHRLRQTAPSREPGAILFKALTAMFLADRSVINGGPTAEQVAQRAYGQDPDSHSIVRATRDLPAFLGKAASTPATTGTAGWAAELVGSQNYQGVLGTVAPASTYAALAARGLRVSFAGIGTIKVSSKSGSSLAGDFIVEGNPIPTRKTGFSSTTVDPVRKLAVLSTFSEELKRSSVPTIENTIRDCISADTSGVLDSKLLDNNAATTARPAGLLNGATSVTAVAGGGAAALGGDLGNLAAAIVSPIDLTFIMTPSDYVRASALLPALSSLNAGAAESREERRRRRRRARR
jgi:hypothetical protein